MKPRSLIASWLVLAVLLNACGIMGQLSPETFNQKLEGGYRTAETIVRSTSILLNAQKINSADAENLGKEVDVGKQGLDISREIHTSDPQAGSDRLIATLAGLRALEAYLRTKE